MLLPCLAMITTNASFNKDHKIRYVLLQLIPVGIANSKTCQSMIYESPAT